MVLPFPLIRRRTRHRWALVLMSAGLTGCGAAMAFQSAVWEAQGVSGDSRENLAGSAESLAKGEIAPEWRAELGHLEVDLIRPVPGERVLVGLVSADRRFGGSSYGPYVLYDEADGTEIWRYEREPSTQHLYEVILDDPVLLVTRDHVEGKETRLSALDPETGQVVWERGIDGSHTRSLIGDVVLLAQPRGAGLTVQAFRISDGGQAWATELSGRDLLPVLGELGGLVTVVTDRVVALEPESGAEVWSSPPIGTPAELSNVLWLQDRVVVATEGGGVVSVARDGSVEWQAALSGTPGILQGGPRHVVAQVVEEDASSLVGLDRDTGRQDWTHPIEGRLNSPALFLESDRLAYTDHVGGQVVLNILEAATGASVCRRDVGLSYAGVRAPEHLVPVGENIIVAQEDWVGAVSPEDCSLSWSRTVDTDLTVDAALSHMEDAITSDELNPSKEAQARSEAAFEEVKKAQHQGQLLGAALALQYQVVHQVQALDRQRFIQDQVQLNAYAMPAGAYMVGATNNAVIAMQEGFRRAEPLARVARFPLELAVARRMHATAISGRYYVRAYSRTLLDNQRWGVRVVDLETGRWTDIITSPHAFAYKGSFTGFSSSGILHAVLTPENRIVVKGLGLDPKVWKPMELGPNTVPGPALLAYALDPSSLHAPDTELVFFGAGVIDTTGAFVLPPRYRKIYGYSEGLASALTETAGERTRHTVVDVEGRALVEPRISVISPYSEGLAAFQDDESAGFLDTRGQVAIEPRFEYKTFLYDPEEMLNRYLFLNGRAVVEAPEGWTLIDRTGKMLVEPGRYEAIRGLFEGFAAAKREGKWGFLDENGREVIPAVHDSVGRFSDGWAMVRDGQAHRFVDTGGSVTLDLGDNYQEVGRRSGDRIRVKRGEYFGFLDSRGEIVLPPETFTDAQDFSEGLAAVHMPSEGWGAVDASGTLVIACEFSLFHPLSHGLALVRKMAGQEYFIFRDGTPAFEGTWWDAGSFTPEGYAWVEILGKRWVRVRR